MAEVQIQAQWKLDPENVPLPANQSLVQIGQNGADFFIVFGHINPPVVEGVGDGVFELTQDMANGLVLPIVPVTRVMLSRAALLDLKSKIETAIKGVDK